MKQPAPGLASAPQGGSATAAHTPARGALTIAALGVVFGDIGTSPVYTFRECFRPEGGLAPTADNLLGALSMIAWALILVVAVKYVLLIMRADNRGEGGIFALLALALGSVGEERAAWFLAMIGLAGAALFYGDSMITPAISVLSAAEGMKVATPLLERFVVPLTVVILIALFVVQKRGTEGIGRLFGPVMTLWFAVIGLDGLAHIVAFPRVLLALSPAYAAHIFAAHPLGGFIVLGAVALAITGGEALYADMGHFGRWPIRFAWFAIVLPCLILNYFGQGALILGDPQALENPFFHAVPQPLVLPLVVLTTAATVIASQSVISGAFSLTHQAIQLGLMPQLDVRQTSSAIRGQIYIPQVNWLLLIAVLGLVVEFQSSDRLASAYGFAVTGTMTITTLLAGVVTRRVWHWPWPMVLAVLAPLLLVDLALFSSNALKIPSGGWFPLAIGIVVFTLMSTWRAGRRLVLARLAASSVPLAAFIAEGCQSAQARVSGVAVYLTAHTADVPVTLLNNLKHNKVLHQTVLFVRVVTENIPRVDPADRLRTRDLGSGFWQVEAHFGFAERPDVPAALSGVELAGEKIDAAEVSYFIGRANVISAPQPGLARWREHLYAGLARIATRPTEFFGIPAGRVIEIGADVEI
ncbi:MAG TPA: potassium transporter Kup [Stellaceae bacterium]|nr:potassium transporter Kup [Stellaceae bacterium]